MIWRNDIDRYVQTDVPDEWKTWGRVPDNFDAHLKLRPSWLSWMACTSKLLQTVDNKHMNRHQDYMYSGPTINFVDLQSTPQIGRRLNIVSHLCECINNYGEFPLDCVVPTPETEIVMGSGRGGGKLVRGMRMKNPDKRLAREAELVSEEDSRGAEKWLKNFNRGIDTEEAAPAGDTGMGDPDGGGNTDDSKNGMVETQIVRMVVRVFPVVHKNFKGIGRVISIIGLPGVNIAKCLQRVCDPRFYDQKHAEVGRSREALWREIVHMEFGVLEQQMRHDDMEGRLCDFENYHDYKYHIFHFCSEAMIVKKLLNLVCEHLTSIGLQGFNECKNVSIPGLANRLDSRVGDGSSSTVLYDKSLTLESKSIMAWIKAFNLCRAHHIMSFAPSAKAKPSTGQGWRRRRFGRGEWCQQRQ